MKGCRPLSKEEETRVLKSFKGKYAARDRAIFILGTKSGFRISELLSLKIGDVMSDRKMLDRAYVSRRNTKRKLEGRSVILHPEAQKALKAWILQLLKEGPLDECAFLFRSQKGENKPIGRIQYYRILQAACKGEKLTGKLGTHTMRKTFANKVYDNLDHDLAKTAQALGHKNVNSTVQYLSFRQEDIDEAILST